MPVTVYVCSRCHDVTTTAYTTFSGTFCRNCYVQGAERPSDFHPSGEKPQPWVINVVLPGGRPIKIFADGKSEMPEIKVDYGPSTMLGGTAKTRKFRE